ncbi:MAG: DUF3987 domain-containing protein [Deltaproteobacteria bacterium]
MERLIADAAPAESVLKLAWPELRPEARHGLAGEILEAIEPHSEADPAALLVTILAGFGAMVGSGPHALADGAEHPARVWALVVGDTAKSRKGTSAAQPRRVFRSADPDFDTERVLGGFGSGESLVDAVAGDEDRRLFVIESEYARILAVGRRDGSTLPALLRQAWDGSRLQVRSRSGTAVADGAHVVVVGHITRGELLAKLAESDALGGSLNRFLIVAARRSKLLPSGGNLDDEVVHDLGRKVVKVVEQTRTVGVVRRTPAATRHWEAIYECLADDEPGGLLGAVIARDAAQLLRLQLTFALMDGSRVIDVDHIRAAQAVWDYSRASAAMIFGELTGDLIADLILATLQNGKTDGLDRTAIRDLLGRNAKRERVDQALALLEERGLATLTTKRDYARGRPRTVVQLVRPTTNTTNTTEIADDELPVNEDDLDERPPSDQMIDEWVDEYHRIRGDGQ